jgi:hypothetical protein
MRGARTSAAAVSEQMKTADGCPAMSSGSAFFSRSKAAKLMEE